MGSATRTKHDYRNHLSPCLWMQAGVVKKKECRVNYRCQICPFDRALRRAAGANISLRLEGQTQDPPSLEKALRPLHEGTDNLQDVHP